VTSPPGGVNTQCWVQNTVKFASFRSSRMTRWSDLGELGVEGHTMSSLSQGAWRWVWKPQNSKCGQICVFCALTGYTDKAEIRHAYSTYTTGLVLHAKLTVALIGEGQIDTGPQSIISAVSLRQTNVYRNLTFLTRDASMLVRSWVVIRSVRPSVFPMRALWLIQRTHWRYFYTTRKRNPSSFLTPKISGK